VVEVYGVRIASDRLPDTEPMLTILPPPAMRISWDRRLAAEKDAGEG
jgi:hypothetical protein